jgi:hypothetical protein
MEEVLYDLQLAEATFDTRRNEFYTDAQKRALIEGVYKKHGINQAIMDSSLVWYADHMEQLIRINDSVVARLRRAQSLLDKQYERELSLENANKRKKLFASFVYLSPAEPLYSFSLDSVNPAMINIAEVDTVRWKIPGFSRNGVSVISSVRFDYADTLVVDSGVNRTEYIAVAPVLYGKTLKNISGYVRVQSRYTDFNVLVYDIRFQSDTISNRPELVEIESQVVVEPPILPDKPAFNERKPELAERKPDTLKPVRPNIRRRTPEMRMQRQRESKK